MPKKRDFFSDFEELEKYMKELTEELMKGFPGEGFFSEKGKPLTWGFSFREGENGEPVIREFGNVKRSGGKPVFSPAKEPLYNVEYGEKEVVVTVELPGVKKSQIGVDAAEGSVKIEVRDRENPYFKEIGLNEKAKPSTAKTKFKNGILEISLKKA